MQTVVAVLSDIHSNAQALTVCLRHALSRGASHFLFLGDFVSQCPDTRGTMDRLYGLRRRFPCRFVRGNREEYMLSYRASGAVGWCDGSATGSLLHAYEQLTDEDLDFFASLSPCGVLTLPDLPPIRFCHGSPESTREGLYLDGKAARRALQGCPEALLLCGHTHVQGSLTSNGKRIVNPGAVGLALHRGGGRAQYALLRGEGGAWQAELLQIPYDVEATLRAFDESGLSRRAPVWTQVTKHILRTGENYTVKTLTRARALCEAGGDIARWPHVSETYWLEALREMGLSFPDTNESPDTKSGLQGAKTP